MPNATSLSDSQNPTMPISLRNDIETQYIKAKLDLKNHADVLLAIIVGPNSECIGSLSSIVRVLDCIQDIQKPDDGKLCDRLSDEQVTLAMRKNARFAVEKFIKCAMDFKIEFSIAYHIHGDSEEGFEWSDGMAYDALQSLAAYASDELKSRYSDYHP